MIRLCILGFGKLGQFIYERLKDNKNYRIVFIWNRNGEKLKNKVPENIILHNIKDLPKEQCDIIIEVCHPMVIKQFGDFLISRASLMIGSPTVLSDESLGKQLLDNPYNHRVWIPTGAMWGIEDIRKLNSTNSIKHLKITMDKHPDSLKITTEKYQKLARETLMNNSKEIIFQGPVRDLCEIAPNNVNTMAVAALACSTLGFDNVIGCLISNAKNSTQHTVTIEVKTMSGLKLTTIRENPAQIGDVTGLETFNSFLSSIEKIREMFNFSVSCIKETLIFC